MSPRAACRLETLGFEQVYDYVEGKVDWVASGLPREGESAGALYAGDVVDADPPTCGLATPGAQIRDLLAESRYGFCLVLSSRRIVLGRVRRSALDAPDSVTTAESVMEPGPSTVRFNEPVAELVQRLEERKLETAVVTTPAGCLVGVFHRDDAKARIG